MTPQQLLDALAALSSTTRMQMLAELGRALIDTKSEANTADCAETKSKLLEEVEAIQKLAETTNEVEREYDDIQG